MIHEIIPVGPLQCNCSIVGDEASHEAMVIDPGAEVSEIMAIVARHGLRVTQIVVTHAHLDHIGGAMELKRLTGAPVLLNENDAALVAMLPVQAQWLGMQDPGKVQIDGSPKTGDKILAGAITAEVLLTPGHTEGSLCLYLPEQKLLVAGDTLFAGSIGRTDLPGGDYKKIMRSLHHQVLALPDEVAVVPGHGPLTTIGEEREQNPFLRK
jgi:glyoxylase-like metal-dependent hydrolase (beta-lactamase superfamily II)